ncbi:MAG: hypothetical protein H7Y88_09290 [Phycisphaerales bacterium]|nr:hypothetical protein [Phycisphaerales bacterium]
MLICVLATPHEAQAQTRIMCVGDSITEGFGGWASYRYPLWFDLQSDGIAADFVGPWTGYHICGGAPDSSCFYPQYLSTFDRHHAGYCGWRTDQVAAVIVNLASGAQPDIVLIHLGTNDIAQQGAAGVNNADLNLRLIIQRLRSVRPNVSILLAQVIPLATTQPAAIHVAPLNARIATIVSELDTPASRVLLVDQNSGFDLSSMMQLDGVHPNTAGEQRMADVWRATLATILTEPPSCSVTQAIPAASSLVALFTFDDGTARDITTSLNRTCVALGNPQFVDGAFEGGGMLLDGASYLRADALIHPSVRPRLTMGGWVRLETTAVGTTLLSHDNGGFDRALLIDNRAGGVGWSAFAGPGGGTDGSGVLGFIPAQAMQWQFVAAVYDASAQSVMLYVDGETRQASGNPGSNAFGQNVYVGKAPLCGGTACTLNGTLDNVFIMSEALSVARLDEIRIGGYRRIPTCLLILLQPLCQQRCDGESVNFSIDAAGSELSHPLTYQWRKDDVPIDIGANPSAATATLTILSVGSSDAGSYDCVVVNACGSAISHSAQLGICDADFNCDSVVTSADITSFLSAWFADLTNGTTIADFNQSGGTTSADITAFLAAWFLAIQGGC